MKNASQNILRKIKKGCKKYDIVSFDIETYGKKNLFLLGGVNDGKYHSFTDKAVMIEYLETNCHDKLIFATNLGFDFSALFYNNKKFFEYKIILRNGTVISCYNGKLKFLDTMNYTPSSVERLGKSLGMKKFFKPKFLGNIPKDKKEWNHLKRYNARDCLITKLFAEKFQEMSNKLGSQLMSTIASTSLNLFRRKYMEKNISHEPFDCESMIRKAYYGGRCEAFKRGDFSKERLYYYDYNSLYPSCMLNAYPLPSSAKFMEYGNMRIIRKYEGVSEVILSTPNIYYPFLPYRKDNKLLFPISSKMYGVYTHVELRKALELGYKIKKIYNTVYYTKTFYPFKKYIETLYRLRLRYKKSNKYIEEEIIKLFMNSLYGKFASKNFDDYIFFLLDSADLRDSFDMDEQNNIGYMKKKPENDWSTYKIPILSVYTTSYGRIKLYKAIIDSEAVYVDTDSCFSHKLLKTSNQLGDLKLEPDIPLIIVKPKVYLKATKDGLKYKIKGFRGITAEGWERIMNNKGVNQEKYMKLRESIIQSMRPNEKKEFDKYMSLEDNKRVWSKCFSSSEIQDSKPVIV